MRIVCIVFSNFSSRSDMMISINLRVIAGVSWGESTLGWALRHSRARNSSAMDITDFTDKEAYIPESSFYFVSV